MDLTGRRRRRNLGLQMQTVSPRVIRTDFPEDPEGGLYGPDRVTVPTGSGPMRSTAADETVFNHEF